MPDFIMMVGLPGSGKSTWANYNCSVTNHVYYSTDAIIEAEANRQKLTYNEIFKDYISIATMEMKSLMNIGVQMGMNIINDQTNLTKRSRAWKIDLARKHGYKTIAVIIPTPEREIWLRRLDRPGKTIPRNILVSMARSYEPPTDKEFDKIIYV